MAAKHSKSSRRRRALGILCIVELILIGVCVFLALRSPLVPESIRIGGSGDVKEAASGVEFTKAEAEQEKKETEEPVSPEAEDAGDDTDSEASAEQTEASEETSGAADGENSSGTEAAEKAEEAASEEETPEEAEMKAAVPEPDPEFHPAAAQSAIPSNMISSTAVMVDGAVLNSVSDYQPQAQIEFSQGKNYTDVEGIISFRGDNFRNSPSFGLANMTENSLEAMWSADTSSLSHGDAYWSGSGWTGQPLIVKWPASTKAVMNMYDWAKEDDELVEVIYACMDGYVYFLDLETGNPTRDKLYLGYTFKGAGALDPRGYPIMYLGAGYDSDYGTSRVFILNLLDCSTMYTFGNNDEFSMRGALSYFDSSALVDAETDTLIYPGENGILYLMKLNTVYDEAAGTLSINPGNIVKWHYWGNRTDTSAYWLGMEDSAVIYKGCIFMADNGGHLMCLDLNTLQLVWVQDILDDSNSTPVAAFEDGHLYIYVSTSFHLGWRSSGTAPVPIWKIDAETGEIVWRTDYECYSEASLSGGVQSTVAVGEQGLSDYLYVTVSRTGSMYQGVLACLDRKTGSIVWEHSSGYAWSSPVCVYNEDGSGNVIYCSSDGNMYLIDGLTGNQLGSLSLSEGVIEASPAVYNNVAVVGTRACKIWGVRLK